MGELRIRSALVTGANRGIGLGFVQHLLALPNPPEVVFAACRDPKGQRAQELQKLASKHRNLVIVPLALCLVADTEGSGHSPPHLASAEVTDPASIKAAAASVGEHLKGSGLNLLINNAGIVRGNTLDTETLKDMSDVYTTNTIGPLLLSQVMPHPQLQEHPCPAALRSSEEEGLGCWDRALLHSLPAESLPCCWAHLTSSPTRCLAV
ncbi:hypothetical protein ASZ78_009046 [Callipepla squamata]|uniref:Ketoreductase (KR) domain-containing protein n=1 Tax=Callipepla squamata TaxID=9009 RepID=A0A226MT91_CALSU|nr:hypothetical protein ASZ78_009046 [Callipepla squamata]